MIMKKSSYYMIALMLGALSLASCGDKEKEYDATGAFEATEVTVSAEQNGKLLQFDINEGDKIEQGKQVGLIDTVQLYLKARQITPPNWFMPLNAPTWRSRCLPLASNLPRLARNMTASPYW